MRITMLLRSTGEDSRPYHGVSGTGIMPGKSKTWYGFTNSKGLELYQGHIIGPGRPKPQASTTTSSTTSTSATATTTTTTTSSHPALYVNALSFRPKAF